MRWLCIVAIVLGSTVASGQTAPDDKLIVGVKEAAPFAMKAQDGTWEGISVELWKGIGRDLGLEYELREVTLTEVFDDLASGEIDVAVAALTVTSEREERVDFTHPFYSSGLGIAVAARARSGWTAIVENLFSLEFLSALVALVAILLLAGALVWAFERRKNAGQFGGSPKNGLASGFWWSAVTMTTVGYGDKAPVTAGGRLVALVWMFASVIVISSFTASIASALTVSKLDTPVKSAEDLPRVRVVTVAGSTSQGWLGDRSIEARAVATPEEAVAALRRGDADAAVYDAPILRYLARGSRDITVLDKILEPQDYGIALRQGTPLRERINRALLARVQSADYQRLLSLYLGE